MADERSRLFQEATGLGLSGDERLGFIRDAMAADRDRRAQDREEARAAQTELKRIEREKEERDRAEARMKEERDREEARAAQKLLNDKEIELKRIEREKEERDREEARAAQKLLNDKEIELKRLEKEKEEKDKQLLFEERKLAEEKVMAEKRLQSEKEISLKKLEMEMKKEEDRQKFEYSKLEIQREQARRDDEYRRAQLELSTRQNDERDRNQSGDHSRISGSQIGCKQWNLHMGKWDPSTDLNSFLVRFELTAKSYGLPEQLWSIEFSKSLDGEALDVFEQLSEENRLNYESLKLALCKKYNLTESGYRTRFKNARSNPNESQNDFVERLKKYLGQWLQFAGYEKSYDELSELIVKDKFYESQPDSVKTFIKENGKMPLKEMVKKAEQYREAHGIQATIKDDSITIKSVGKAWNRGRNTYQNQRGSFNQQSPRPLETKSDTNFRTENQQSVQVRSNSLDRNARSSGQFSNRANFRGNCWICGITGHRADQCRYKQSPQGQEQQQRTSVNVIGNGSHQRGLNQSNPVAACQVIPHHIWEDGIDGNDRVAMMEGENNPIPIVAAVFERSAVVDSCLVDLKLAHSGIGTCNGKDVSWFRDTGSSISIAKSSLVNESQYTGRNIKCLLIDGCAREFPEATVHMSTPYFTGMMKVAVINNPLSDVIVGNNVNNQRNATLNQRANDNSDESSNDDVSTTKTVKSDNCGHRDPVINIVDNTATCDAVESNSQGLLSRNDGSSEEPDSAELEELNRLAAVQTRAQTQLLKNDRKIKPLKVEHVNGIDLSPEEFRKLQIEDKVLEKYWTMAREHVEDTEHKAKYVIKNGLLYREYRAMPSSDVIEQLVIPEQLVNKVVAYGHMNMMSGHLGIANTLRRVLAEFYAPGITSVVTRFVHSCDRCQRSGNNNRGRKAPMFSMPISTEPNYVNYIDIVGEITPPSAEGHRWILSIVDSATRFPSLVAMKRIDSVSVAEALLGVWTTLGMPRIVHSDNGTQLISEAMKEIYALLGIKGQSGPCYRPQANSVVERFHSTMKNILRKLVAETPNQWHRYLNPLLFAMRTMILPCGYSSFELMMGRSGYTHMRLLKTLWNGEPFSSEVKTTYQHVLDLRERIEETCKIAHDELEKVQIKNKKYRNKCTTLRELKPGDEVLVLIPDQSNHLFFSWKGPADVIERRGFVTYRVRLPSGLEKSYHINMLKKYERPHTDEPNDSDKTEAKVDNSDEERDVNMNMNGNEDDSEYLAGVMGVVEEDDCDMENMEGEGDFGKIPLYSTRQTETWKDVKINPELTADKKAKLWTLVEKYGDIFSDVPTQTHLINYKIELTSDIPVQTRPYKLPIHLIEPVENEIKEMLEHGWIERAENSRYASGLVVVAKKGTSDIRLCVNYAQLNDITIQDPMPTPEIDDILAKIGPSEIFSTVDMAKGFYAVPLEESCRDFTTFVTPRDAWRFTVLPFGLRNSPAVYAKLLRKMLEGSKHMDNFVDDVIAHDMNFDYHLLTLEDLFKRVRSANVKIKPSKTNFGYSQVEFLGHVVDGKTIKPTRTNIEKLISAPIPQSKKAVHSFIGMTNFLRKWVPNCAEILKPLNELTRNSSPEKVCWLAKHQAAFDEIKRVLTSEPVLTRYDMNKKHVIMTDASQDALAGCLLQEEEDGLHPVMYASIKLLPRESRYSIGEKEAYAVVFSIRRFYKYIYGRHFGIQTDCQSLSILNGKLANNARVMRWQLFLQSFNFTVEVIRGKDNGISDYLSRMYN